MARVGLSVDYKLLRALRQTKGMSRRQVVTRLAEQGIYYSPNTLGQVETGRRNPSAQVFEGLCKVMHLGRDTQLQLLADEDQRRAWQIVALAS